MFVPNATRINFCPFSARNNDAHVKRFLQNLPKWRGPNPMKLQFLSRGQILILIEPFNIVGNFFISLFFLTR